MIDTSCVDWKERLLSGQSLLPDVIINPELADRAAGIFDMLTIPDIIGTPRMRDAAGEWLRDIVRAIFGVVDENGVRHVREFFELIPKKNSKTTGGAGIMLTALLVNKRPKAQFLMVAPTKDVANLAFSQAVGMIENDPVLSAKFHVQGNIKNIVDRVTGASLMIKAFDTRVMTGVAPTGVLIDELHVISEHSQADRIIGQIRGGIISQEEAFILTITTQSEREPSGVFKAELERARAVRDGRVKASLLPMLYEFPKGTDWEDSSLWKFVNPNHGRSLEISRLVEDYDTAKLAGDAELKRWASQHLNVQIGLMLLEDSWSGGEFWEGNVNEDITLDYLIENSEVICCGIDAGGLDDLLGFCAIGRHKDTGKWMVWTHSWAHEIVLSRRESIAPELLDFQKDGDLTIVKKAGEDVQMLAQLVAYIDDSGLLYGVGCDPAGVASILDKLEEEKIDREKLFEVSQGWRLVSAITTSERRLAEGLIQHAGQPIMRWCVGNAKVEMRANSFLITKQASGRAKIDSLMAFFDAVHLMATNPEAQNKGLVLAAAGG